MKANWKYIIILVLVVLIPAGTILAAGYFAKKKLASPKKAATPDVDPSTVPDSDGSNDYNSNEGADDTDNSDEEVDDRDYYDQAYEDYMDSVKFQDNLG